METSDERDGMFTCSATFADILIVGEQLRVDLHNAKSLVKDQRHHFRWHNSCFLGSEVVSWLVKTGRAAERFIAVALLDILLEHNIIRHVTSNGHFKDDSHLYRFRKDDGTYDFSEDTTVFLHGHRLIKRLSSDPQGRKIVRVCVHDQQLYPHSFPGCELIDWMVQRQESPSREAAVREIRTMLESGILRHVTDAHHFKDSSALYQFRTGFGRDRLLLDLVLPPPSPEFGGPLAEDSGSEASGDNNNSGTSKSQIVQAASSPSLRGTEAYGSLDKVVTERTESGYHSDHLEVSPHSSLSESPMYDTDDRRDKAAPFSGGVLVRKVTAQELEDPNSPYIRKFIRIVSDPVGYGFVIRGEGPVYIKTVDPKSPAAAAGLKVGHHIYSINDQKVMDMNHRDLAHVILDSNGYVTLVVMEHVRDSN